MESQLTPVVDDTPRAADRVPRSWDRLTEEFPAVVAAYDALSEVCREAGPLDPATVALVKLAVSVGRGSQRTVHSHAKKALRAGADPNALRQIVLVSLPTIGLPAALDALRWVDESIRETSPATGAKQPCESCRPPCSVPSHETTNTEVGRCASDARLTNRPQASSTSQCPECAWTQA